MKDKVRITQHDILTLKVDAIICQANQELEPEDSEVKRIFQNGGDEVYSECDHQNNLAVGSAVITSAGELPARYLIHAVIYESGGEHPEAEEEKAMQAIQNALQIAKQYKLKKIAIPIIGQSVGIPMKRSAELIFSEIKKYFDEPTTVQRIYLVAANDYEEESLEEALKQM